MADRNLTPRLAIARRAGYFTLRPVNPGELPSLMNKHILSGCLGAIWANLVTGIIYIYFGNAIGMTQLEWGILGGISAWVVAAQVLGAVLGERVKSRKIVFFWFAISDRVVRLVGITFAYLIWRTGNHAGYLVFMMAICFGTFLGTIANGPWYGWLATIIPQQVQGTFWGRRDSRIALATVVVLLPSGLLMDLIPEAGKLDTAFAILVAASFIGFTDLIIHGTIPEPPHETSPARGSLSNVMNPLRDMRFRPWLIFVACWNLAQSLGGALCTLYFMQNLGFNHDLLGGMIAINGIGLVGTLLGARRVGRMVDRFGIKRMLMLGYVFWSALPSIWLLATPHTAVLWVGLASLVGGVFPAAANNAGIKLVTRFRPPEESSMYMAVSTTVGSVAGGFGSIAAGLFVSAMGSSSLTVLGLVVSAFPMLFITSAALRLATCFLIIPRIKVMERPVEENRAFLLPLFFEAVPGISRIMRGAAGRMPLGATPSLAAARQREETVDETTPASSPKRRSPPKTAVKPSQSAAKTKRASPKKSKRRR